ncbi:serine/threonine-protein kinase/endoribonuclease ire-1-like isoform X2 [Daphnia pulicaria]|nr:serine/threonine-protein kinase/endoribonuclease ire-1-like isoform X2 [Daphnia pulicaria]
MIKIDKGKILGEGAYGIVFEGTFGEQQVAVKRIQTAYIVSNEKEEAALKKLDHPNVIKLFHICSDEEFRYYALELCQSSLEKLFLKIDSPKKYRGPMPSQKEVLLQLAEGLEYIHINGLIHRDLKPENVLIWADSTGKTVLMKWADFGLSKPVNERGSHSISGVSRGTDNWYAPEILKIMVEQEENENKSSPRQRGTIKSDVFTEGLIFAYYLLNGVHPFGSRFERVPNIIADNPSVHVSKIQGPIHGLIMEMLKHNPEERISSSEVVEKIRLMQF